VIKFYYSLAPNPMKVALFLEEAGLPYEAIPVDTRKGDQFAPAFAALNPNNKVPCIVGISRPSRRSMPSPATRSRRSGITASSTRIWRSTATWSARPTGSSIWRSGAGRG